MSDRNVALLGIDLGTSSAKVLACDQSGVLLAAAVHPYPLRVPRPGFVELDPGEVMLGADAALRDVLAALRERRIAVAALGLSGAMHGIVPVDARGAPLGPCLTWLDRRSADVAAAWQRDGTAARLYAATGAPIHPMLPSCKLRWLAQNDPALVARAAKFVSLKELLAFRLTGEWAIDWGMASGTGLFGAYERGWHAAALDLAGVSAERLSQPAAPSTRLRLRDAVARDLALVPNVPLVLASSDGALANLGVGAVGVDDFALTLGTSGALRVVVDEPVLDRAGRTFCYAYDDRCYIVGGATSSAGAVLARFEEWLLGDTAPADRPARAVALAAAAPLGARGLTLAPFLSGERAPYWRVDLHGTLAGLDLAHERGDLLRAAFESIVFAVRSVYDVLLERLPAPRRLRLSGGLVRPPFVRQLIADVFDCETVFTEHADASAFGAALMAGVAVGLVADAADIATSPSALALEARNVAERIHVEQYAAAFDRYRRVVAATLQL
ncbi:MAG: gluconokinase [Candidatus Eremiobacteraeota bacterium]|nr:gluconokinase [Candidatus Eremiobacteraeota bacterium]MBC5802870.1 gluconokinase [Candidatus Eremiobacteraeota bacterium]MBC5821531.1 gluconokinase [Candidatus Eremiobacteraeota bacterium]